MCIKLCCVALKYEVVNRDTIAYHCIARKYMNLLVGMKFNNICNQIFIVRDIGEISL